MNEFFESIVVPDWEAFRFLRPEMLWLFIAAAIAVIVQAMGNRERNNRKKAIAQALRPYMFSKGSSRTIILPLVLLSIGFGCTILSLAGPTWKKRKIPGEKIPSVVIISLDLSRSMTAEDIQPSRLERAKMKIADFMDADPRARTGLIAFAGTPHVVLPFTADYKLIKHHAASLYHWEMPVQGTDMALNIALIDTMMKRIEAPSTVLLMTDVIDNDDAAFLANYIDNTIHHLEILLFSTPAGALVPGISGIESRQSPGILDNLRQNEKINITGITLDKSDVAAVAKRISNRLMFEKSTEKDDKDWDDMGWVLLTPTLIIALLWFRKGWTVQWCIIPVVVSFVSCGVEGKHPDLWYTSDYQGELWERKGNYTKAAELFRDNPHKAAAYFKAGDYGSAADLLATDTTAVGRYNYGLTLTRLGFYDEATESFRQAAAQDSSLRKRADRSIDAAKLLKDQASDVLRFQSKTNPIDSILKHTEKEKLKKRKPKAEDEQLSSDTEAKKLPTSGDRLSDETASDIHRTKEQKFPPKDFKQDAEMPIETKVLMQKTNADPGEFLHRRFEIQKQKFYPEVKQGKEPW